MIKRMILCNLIFAFLILQLTGCGLKEKDFAELSISHSEDGQQESISDKETTQINTDFELIYIYITGCVKNPGVYSINKSERMISAVKLAGGFTDEASEECVNLASKLEDGEHIKILSKKQYKKISEGAAKDTNSYNFNECTSIDNSNASDNSNLININTASKEELCSLAGIGEAKAASIIEYRAANGFFQKIEDIKNVSGIGENVFNRIKDSITV
ncbi:MAG: helix-hairpin-helix domain-containing protein [Lachnospiraceae bacterium]|nr:helix-hairpin-helix domain-containing protein [Lachnospiraceae bacterium]